MELTDQRTLIAGGTAGIGRSSFITGSTLHATGGGTAV
jgi:hypothetical protein